MPSRVGVCLFALACFASCAAPSAPPEGARGADKSVVEPGRLWPAGIVYLVGDRDSWPPGFGEAYDATVAELRANTPLEIRLIGAPSEAPDGYFTVLQAERSHTPEREHATLGASMGRMVTSKEHLRHELGHVMGLHHSQQRTDRDEHIVLQWNRVSPSPQRHAYERIDEQPHIGPFDAESIMHYASGHPGQCAAITRRLSVDERGSMDPASCVRETDVDRWLPRHNTYSAGDYTVLSALYCDARHCGDRCAPDARCAAVEGRLTQLHDWEARDEGRAWARRYPWAGPEMTRQERAEVVATTCSNGVQDESEQGVDCGGACWSCIVCEQQQAVPEADCESLRALFDATGGPHWTARQWWGEFPDPTLWHGVSVAYHPVDGNRVVRLRLPENGLVGSLPTELGDLAGLRALDLYGNGLEGEIPATFGNLSRLAVLSLGLNRLRGHIPSELGALPLQRLELHHNALSGEVPETLLGLHDDTTTLLHGNGCLEASSPELSAWLDQYAPFWNDGCP